MTIVYILLVVALCVALGYVTRLLLESRAREEALFHDNVALAQRNAELTIISAAVFSAADYHKRVASGLALENESHVTNLNMLLAEMEKAR